MKKDSPYRNQLTSIVEGTPEYRDMHYHMCMFLLDFVQVQTSQLKFRSLMEEKIANNRKICNAFRKSFLARLLYTWSNYQCYDSHRLNDILTVEDYLVCDIRSIEHASVAWEKVDVCYVLRKDESVQLYLRDRIANAYAAGEEFSLFAFYEEYHANNN